MSGEASGDRPVHEAHRAKGPATAGFAAITVSDTRTPETDTGGRTLCDLVEGAGHRVAIRVIVRDEPEDVERAVRDALAMPEVDLVVLTGGTGLSARDGTVEVVSRLLEKPIDGFGELFRFLGFQQVGSAAMLSRATGGLVRGKFVFALPGSPRAVRLAMEALILPEVSHLLFEARR